MTAIAATFGLSIIHRFLSSTTDLSLHCCFSSASTLSLDDVIGPGKRPAKRRRVCDLAPAMAVCMVRGFEELVRR